MVNHQLLILKLKLYGFPNQLIQWIASYLSGRSQKVFYNSHFSSGIPVTSGVPQGSHLGPLLFLLFINDLPSVIVKSSILLYADDVKLYHASQSDNPFLQADLDRITNWCNLNCIKLNLEKCKHMVFARKILFTKTYSINNKSLSSVDSIPDLGVTLDTKLRFDLHINCIVSKAFRTLGFIKRWAKEFKDPYVTKLLFTILEYASVVWCPSYACDISRIESVQKQFLLFCLRHLNWGPVENLPSYNSRLKLIDLPSLEARRSMLNILFVFKLFNGCINCPVLLDKLNINIPMRPSRYLSFFKIEYFKQNYLNNQPFRIACIEFNKLYFVIDFYMPIHKLKADILQHLNS